MKDLKKEKEDHEYCLETIEADKATEETVLALAERYYRIHALKLYEPFWSSFEEYCMEIKNRNYKTVMKLIDIHAQMVVKYKIPLKDIASAGGWSVIAEMLPVIKNKEDATKWLKRAREVPREHLRQDVRETRKGIPIGECAHKSTVMIRVCNDCGYKERV